MSLKYSITHCAFHGNSFTYQGPWWNLKQRWKHAERQYESYKAWYREGFQNDFPITIHPGTLFIDSRTKEPVRMSHWVFDNSFLDAEDYDPVGFFRYLVSLHPETIEETSIHSNIIINNYSENSPRFRKWAKEAQED